MAGRRRSLHVGIAAILAIFLPSRSPAAEEAFEVRKVEGHPFAFPSGLTPLGDQLVFEASFTPPGLSSSVASVWVTDGTAAGTSRLVLPKTQAIRGHNLLGVAGQRVFLLATSLGGGTEVHAYDIRTRASERILPRFAYGATASKDHLFFQTLTDLYRSDGTARGTRRLRAASKTGSFMALTDGLLFEAPHRGGVGLFFARARGTQLLATLSKNAFYARVGQKAFFAHGNEGQDDLWSTDGTQGGTVMIASPNPARSLAIHPCLGQALLFGPEAEGMSALWVSDGTREGTKSFALLPQWIFDPFSVADTGTTCMFLVGGTQPPGGLWKTDLTAGGTERVGDLYLQTIHEAATGGSGRAFFSAVDPDHSAEAWTSNGTPEGTYEIADVFPGSIGSLPAEFTTVGPRVFWSAMNEYFSRDLWMAEALPTLSIEDSSVAERGRPVPLLFKVRLSHRFTETVTVDYATADDTAKAAHDFVSAAGTLRFHPGETQKTVRVTVLADGVSEPREQLLVRLTNPDNAELGRDEARGTIEPGRDLPGPR